MFRVVNCASTCANYTFGSVGIRGEIFILTAARVVAAVVVKAITAAFASASAMHRRRVVLMFGG